MMSDISAHSRPSHSVPFAIYNRGHCQHSDANHKVSRTSSICVFLIQLCYGPYSRCNVPYHAYPIWCLSVWTHRSIKWWSSVICTPCVSCMLPSWVMYSSSACWYEPSAVQAAGVNSWLNNVQNKVTCMPYGYSADMGITTNTTSNISSTCVVLALVASRQDLASPQQSAWSLSQQLFSQRFYSSFR